MTSKAIKIRTSNTAWIHYMLAAAPVAIRTLYRRRNHPRDGRDARLAIKHWADDLRLARLSA